MPGSPAEDEKLDNLLTKLWEINDIPEENEYENKRITKFQETIRLSDVSGRCNVKLPWKENKIDLPTNFSLSKKGLHSLQN